MDPYVGAQTSRFVTLGLASLVSGFAEAGLLFLIVQVATAMAAGEDRVAGSLGPLGDIELRLPVVLMASAALLVGLLVLAFLISVIAARLTANAVSRARKDMVRAFLESGWTIQSREREGGLQELLSAHTYRIALGVNTLTIGLGAALSFAAFMITAVAISPLAAVTILVGVAALYLILRPLTRMTKTRSRRQAVVNSEYAIEVTEVVSLAREIRAYDVGEEFVEALASRADEAARTHVSTRILARLTPSVYQYSALLLVLGGIAAVYVVDPGDVANLGAVVLLLVRALSYSQQVNSSVQQAAEVSPYLEELDRQLAIYRDHRVERGGRPLAAVERLSCQDVRYSYEPGRAVLDGITFDIAAGQVLGIVGPSGSGKSTLVQVLLRLRDPDDGSYLVNGEPASGVDLGAWSRQVALVPQDNRLVRGTIDENIRFFRSGLDRDDIEGAARSAHLHEDILQLPAGYDTVVGSGAIDLSGGQRQRLGLARALVRQPSVLVLDEPTSALDMRSESLIQVTLQELKSRLTIIIVAHRMSTLSICDRIMVLEQGRVEAFGTPEELRKTSAFFAEATRLARLPA